MRLSGGAKCVPILGGLAMAGLIGIMGAADTLAAAFSATCGELPRRLAVFLCCAHPL